VGLGIPVVVQGPWRAPDIYPEMAGILDNPEATYAKLREMGKGLFGAAGGNSGGAASDQLGGNLGETLGALIQQGLGATRNSPAAPRQQAPQGAPSDPSARPDRPEGPSPMDGILKQLFGR
jgi:AsmA protein